MEVKKMNSRINSAFLTLFVVGLFSLFTVYASAQTNSSVKIDENTKTCSGKKFVMPPTISADSDAFENYLKLALMPKIERRRAFSELLNEQKANFIKVNLALQFVKRPNMTKEQQEFVLDAISKVSADLYDKSDFEKARRVEQSAFEIENKALGLFSLTDAGDFIEPLGTDKNEEATLLHKYEDLLKNGSKTRMKIAKEMPINDRVNIWRTQLAYHLATGKFSKAQNEFILEMLTSFSPEFFTPRANLTEEEKSKADKMLLLRIFSVFTKEEAFAIFMTLGIQKYVKDEPTKVIDLLRPPICDCNWYCPGNPSCGGPNGCMSSPDGCGPGGTLGCHYLCVT
jgi:hypothetical protein